MKHEFRKGQIAEFVSVVSELAFDLEMKNKAIYGEISNGVSDPDYPEITPEIRDFALNYYTRFDGGYNSRKALYFQLELLCRWAEIDNYGNPDDITDGKLWFLDECARVLFCEHTLYRCLNNGGMEYELLDNKADYKRLFEKLEEFVRTADRTSELILS